MPEQHARKRRLGQHFLTDTGILERIVDFADPSPEDTVVEIGPGRGHLTRLLAARVRHLIAIEVDTGLIPALRETLPPNVDVVAEDALRVDLRGLATRYAVIANLPYNISTPLLDRFVRTRDRISRVTVLVQREVADRIAAEPGTRAYGALSVGMQHYASVRSGFLVPPGAFRPPPKVFSRVVRFDWRDGVPDAPEFIGFVRRAFGSRRKKLVNNLAAILPARSRAELEALLLNSGLSPDSRPESLGPNQFLELWEALGGRPSP